MLLNVVIAAISVVFVAILIKRIMHDRTFSLYKKQEFLFTKGEAQFYHILSKTMGHNFLVMGKVRIADVISVHETKNKRNWFISFNKIACKHFDYVLLDKHLRILAVVELDDISHSNKDRIERDVFVNKVCKAAKIPIIRVKAKKYYMPNEIKQAVFDVLNSFHAS